MKFQKITIYLTLIILLSACTERTQREGQKQPLLSPSGEYTVEMPILKSNKKLDYDVWTPTIKNTKGDIVYTDFSSNLSGYHNSYWDWGRNPENGSDELWVYNSDIGEVTRYHFSNNQWRKDNFKTRNDLPEAQLPKIIQTKVIKK